MSARKPPLLLRGGLTGRVYVVTSYTDHGDGRFTAHTKHDVTDQYEALRAEDLADSESPLTAQTEAGGTDV